MFVPIYISSEIFIPKEEEDTRNLKTNFRICFDFFFPLE